MLNLWSYQLTQNFAGKRKIIFWYWPCLQSNQRPVLKVDSFLDLTKTNLFEEIRIMKVTIIMSRLSKYRLSGRWLLLQIEISSLKWSCNLVQSNQSLFSLHCCCPELETIFWWKIQKIKVEQSFIVTLEAKFISSFQRFGVKLKTLVRNVQLKLGRKMNPDSVVENCFKYSQSSYFI